MNKGTSDHDSLELTYIKVTLPLPPGGGSKRLTSLVLQGKVISRMRKSLFHQPFPPGRHFKYLAVIEVRAPHHLQCAITAMVCFCFGHGLLRIVVCRDIISVKADAVFASLFASISGLQIFINKRRVDNRVFAVEEDSGIMAQKVVLPQNVLRPEERAGECVRYSHVLRAKVP